MNTNLSISSGAITDRGLSEKRPENQDSYLELSHAGIYAVADGVGGAQAGEVASQMAVEILAEAFNNMAPGADAEVVMRSAIEKANSAINQMAQDIPQLSTMATTIVALHLKDNIATIGHVGDSRLYRVDRNGNFYRETDDHSMVAEEVRAGRMTEEQAENHPSRNIISRALGAEPTVAVDLKTIMIDGGTAFLICSDGITRHVTDQEIKGVLTFGGSPTDICEYLKDLCYHRGAEDNLTAVVVKTSSAQQAQMEEVATTDLAPEPDIDEPTVAAARATAMGSSPAEHDEDDVLELDGGIGPALEHPRDLSETDQEFDNTPMSAESRPISADPPEFTIEPPLQPEQEREIDHQRSDDGEFTMFGNSGSEEAEPEKRSVSRALSAIGLLLLGAVLGIGVYYFAMAPQPVDTDGPRLSEMRAANIPLSAFEENRRNVDKDPANYIAKFGSDPQDSEDHYLLGRAYLLTGDYANAKLALTEARNRLPQADPTNAAVLVSDIAMALVVINATTAQTMLRNELDATRPAPVETPANANSVP
jgi:serine/threonine protein phosphatase PrpC